MVGTLCTLSNRIFRLLPCTISSRMNVPTAAVATEPLSSIVPLRPAVFWWSFYGRLLFTKSIIKFWEESLANGKVHLSTVSNGF